MGFWGKRILTVTLMFGLAVPALAEDIALVIGNRDYQDLSPVPAADRVVSAASRLRDEDVALIAGQNVGLDELRDLVSQFEQMAARADGLLVVLAGRFVQGGNETFFLPVDSDLPGLTALPGQSLPVSLVMQLLSRAPGQAFLVLADDGRDVAQGPFLRDGIGDLVIPQGVTVLRGSPEAAANAIRGSLAVRDGSVALAEGVDVAGYLPDGHGFLRSEAGSGAALAAARAETAQAQARADTAQRALDALRAQLARLDAAAWGAAQAENNLAGYRRYVEQFPQGANAREANRLIRDISDDPLRDARLAEEALALSRDQRRAVQRDLTALGFNTRGIDGIFGQGTRGAIRAWQAQGGRVETGYLNASQLRALGEQANAAEAARRAEEAARAEELARSDRRYWQRTGSGNSEDGLRAYLERFPRGQFAQEARNRLERIDRVRRDDETARREEERRRQDDQYWRDTGEGQTLDGLRAYLERFPRGAFAQEARNRLERMDLERRDELARREQERQRQDDQYWRDIGEGQTEDGLRAYLDRYPNGMWSDEARRRLVAIERDRDGDDRGERRAWAQAQRADTIDAYLAYIDQFPRGAQVATAEARIAALESTVGGGRAEEDALNLNGATRLLIEAALVQAGFDPGPVDGSFDRAFRRALRQYQEANGMDPTGFVSQPMLARLTVGSILNRLGNN